MSTPEFTTLLQELHLTDPQPNPRYWETLTNNAQIVLLELSFRKQAEVALDLGLSLPKLNHLVPLLREFTANRIITINKVA